MSGKEELYSEIATRAAAQGFSGLDFLAVLPDPDPILRKKSEYASVLEDLTADDQVCASIQQRKLKTLLKGDYTFSPGAETGEPPTSEAERLCDALSKDLERVDLKNLISQVLDAPYHGYTVAELMWEQASGRNQLVDVVVKPRSWFGFDPENQLVFLHMDGEPRQVPEHKFLLTRHFPEYTNPYGLRLLSRCLWPVTFKKAGVRWWSRFCEKYGFPWTVGEATGKMSAAERQDNAQQLRNMVEDAVAVVSGMKLHVHEVSGKGEQHNTFVERWDAAIAKVLMGQTLTSDVGKSGTGTYAQARTHYQVLGDFAAADASLVETFFTDLAWTYGQVNGASALTPVFHFKEPEDQAQQAELDSKLYATGVRFKKSHYVNRYGLAEEDFEVASAADAGALQDIAPSPNDASPNPPRAGEGAFAAPSLPPTIDAGEGQDALDGMVDAMLGDAGSAVQRQADSLLALVESAESYEDALLLLAEALGPEDGDELAEQLLAGMVTAEMLGRWAASSSDEPGEVGE